MLYRTMHQRAFIIRQPKTKELHWSREKVLIFIRAKPNRLHHFTLLRTKKKEKLAFQIIKPTWGHPVSQIGSSCSCHITNIAINRLFSSEAEMSKHVNSPGSTDGFDWKHMLHFWAVTRKHASFLLDLRGSGSCIELGSKWHSWWCYQPAGLTHLGLNLWGRCDVEKRGGDTFFYSVCVWKDCSMGTANKTNCCSQQTEDRGGGMTSRCLQKKTFGTFWKVLQKNGDCWKRRKLHRRCKTKYVLAAGLL